MPSASASQAPSPPPPPLPKLERVVRAWRCAECHEKMYAEWEESPHANAAKSELFLAMRKQADEHDCNRCHAPLKRRIDSDRIAAEGVTCEVCHRMQEAAAKPTGAAFELDQQEAMKYGPLCDPEYPYFHEAECRDFFEKSELCGSCHLWHKPTTNGKTLPVYTEYQEWRESSYAKQNKQCQNCHMPGEKARIANGEKERLDVPHHSFFGGKDSLVGTGIVAQASISADGDTLVIDVELENKRAGHALPGVHRKLVLEARALSESGELLSQGSASYAREYADDVGKVAPFFLATEVKRDTRIAAREKRTQSFRLQASQAGSVSLRLLRYSHATEVADKLGLDAPEAHVVLTAQVKVGPPVASGQRRLVPRKVALKP